MAFLVGIELSLHEAELAVCLVYDWANIRDLWRSNQGHEAVLLLGRSQSVVLDIQVYYYLVRMSLHLHLVLLDVFEGRLVKLRRLSHSLHLFHHGLLLLQA